MLLQYRPPRFSDIDLIVFDALVRRDHPLRLALQVIDFIALRQIVEPSYKNTHSGRPAYEPLVLIKLVMLCFRDRLSDRQVIERASTDIAYRFFLQLGLSDALPDPSLLTYFRARLQDDGFQKLFDNIVKQAKQAGLLKERLRILDCTHILADASVPTTLQLLAQLRDRVLEAATIFDPERVAGERLKVIELRTATDGLAASQRLSARITHAFELRDWMNQLSPPADAADNPQWQQFQEQLKLLCKVLLECGDPKLGDRTRSAVDPDARRGRHGDFFDGFQAATMMDADSEIITSVDVRPANNDEAASIPALVRAEENAQDTDIETVSIDKAGCNGKLLRELQDPAGLNLNVIVPPKDEPQSALFKPQQFEQSVDGKSVTCPAGKTSYTHQHAPSKHAQIYRFDAATCASCPLLAQCMAKAPRTMGRTVTKTDYEAEHQGVREKAQTEEYASVRREHPAIERKQAEMIRQHGLRRARYRGLTKVRCQLLMTATVVNIKRLIKLLGGKCVFSRAR